MGLNKVQWAVVSVALILLLAVPALAGEPELYRVVAWSPSHQLALVAVWGGVSHEDSPPTRPASNYIIYRGDKQLARAWCSPKPTVHAGFEARADNPSAGWHQGKQTLAVADCSLRTLIAKIPGAFSTAGNSIPLTDYRVSHDKKDGRATVFRRVRGQEIRVGTAIAEDPTVIQRVVEVQGRRIVVLRTDFDSTDYGFPYSVEVAVFESR